MFEKIMMKIQIFFIWLIVAIMVCFVAVAEIASVRYLAQYYCHYCKDNMSGILQFDTEERLVYKTCELCGSRYESFSPKSITDMGTTEVDCEGNYYKIELWTYMFGGWTMEQSVYFAQNTGLGENHLSTIETKPAVTPTCTTDGCTAEIVCQDCEKIIQPSVVVPATHDTYLTGVITATCQREGYSGDVHCHHCDYFEEGSVLPITDHDTYLTGVVESTCTTYGYTGDTRCHNCSYIVPGTVNEMHSHDLYQSHPGSSPSCMRPGYTAIYSCRNCTHEEGGIRIPEVDHDYFKNMWGNYECAWCKRIKT